MEVLINFFALFNGNMQLDDTSSTNGWSADNMNKLTNHLRDLETDLGGRYSPVEIANYTHDIYRKGNICFTFKYVLVLVIHILRPIFINRPISYKSF